MAKSKPAPKDTSWSNSPTTTKAPPLRAWIGTEDRTASSGQGEYTASHDDYDVHAMAPEPLPDGAKWWIELELPAGPDTCCPANNARY
ncbi:MAG: hypothetical protein R3F17_09245 [Planctomycetota bacterium]